jgi:hypothetical protein
VSILGLAKGDPDRGRVLSAIILSPPVFAELHKGFGDELPLSAKTLLVKKGFTPKAANEVVRICRSNLEFLNAEPDAETEPAEIHSDVPKSEAQRSAPEDFRRPTAEFRKEAGVSEQVLQFKIAESTEARIQLRGLVTQEAIKKRIS